jgi:hypothetical protein
VKASLTVVMAPLTVVKASFTVVMAPLTVVKASFTVVMAPQGEVPAWEHRHRGGGAAAPGAG